MIGDVEIANAESEVHRVNVFESRDNEWSVCERECKREDGERGPNHWTGRSRSASLRLPSRYP